ncbi:MAG TPA: RNA polymerase sigma factor [Bacillota bacterium]|nr:RNA polymerase sigma factor [Bacillota bacterium]
MEDNKIVELYWERDEAAIEQSSAKYGRYCRSIAYNILYNDEDVEECLNDTWMRAWGSIPPARPVSLRAFLGKITRNLALDRYDAARAQKRGGGEFCAVLDELSEYIPDTGSGYESVEDIEIEEILNSFLESLSPERRKVFMRRYWYMDSIKEIAEFYEISESKVKTVLFRSRAELKAVLTKEGIEV